MIRMTACLLPLLLLVGWTPTTTQAAPTASTIRPYDLGLCPTCGFHNLPEARLCGRCLRALRWPTMPPRVGPGTVVVREGFDTFIRSWNDQMPPHRFDRDAGADAAGPLGTWYELTGLRYLVWFDIPKAVAEAGRSLETFTPTRATLVLRVLPTPESPVEVPVAAFLLTRPFLEGPGRWHRHVPWEQGTTWTHAAPMLPWERAGGDFAPTPMATGRLPATGSAEIYLDVSELIATRFAEYRRTGEWFDPGLILMRDPTAPGRCRYRMIQGFQAAPGTRPLRSPAPPRSPELYLE
ncbi:MAG: hypothetical protein OZSIB_1216 [Candidatus Ozemobacter sibiricus]|uniref:Uncharacterized protein n=1 Tax=Candidatus Ozemobacter sibiricus TaxID=2268124 RepID=A0A367ZLQ7_9BACT|nr:MAG: hypothetical protein OZSIB_1216 [Candidatus Ozemobacter sibiricus]